MKNNYMRVKLGCYATNVSMSVVANLSPILFITFNKSYGISFSLLGLLVLINFCTQLSVDLIFSFFSRKFNIPAVVKLFAYERCVVNRKPRRGSHILDRGHCHVNVSRRIHASIGS